MQANATIAPKLSAVFSQRMATRLKRLSLPIACSIRARVLYSTFGKKPGLFLAFERCGMTGMMRRLRQAARLAAESYPLSVSAARGGMSGPMSSEVASWVQSLTSPPVRWKAMGRPWKSVLRWILHEKPPRERPSA